MGSEGIRINKYLSEIGYCSRRQADKLIEQGRIMVNSKEAVMGYKVQKDDVIHVDGEKNNSLDFDIMISCLDCSSSKIAIFKSGFSFFEI